VGGLGFGMKWDMGWMHDTLTYMSFDPVYRKYHHNRLTFRMLYAFNENFVLPLSHDEIVYGKRSLINKMPGDYWQKFANLRLLFGYMYAQPGKKMVFMGGEIGQWNEWQHETSLDWNLLGFDSHRQLQHWVSDLNRVYREENALYYYDCQHTGFEWIDCNDSDHSIISFIRWGKNHSSVAIIICNFTPVVRFGYRIGAPRGGFWKEILNSDAFEYGGSGVGNLGGFMAEPRPFHGRPFSLNLTLPPLSILFFRHGE
jgi:1,4-alpha-glucan branching enzyme